MEAGDPLQAILEELRVTLDVGRCTLRQPLPGDVYLPVTHEVLAHGAPVIADDTSVDLRTQPVPRRLAAGDRQVVQEDCRAASDEPAFHAMLERYGGMRAQVVTGIRDGDGSLVGVLSVHELRAPRAWSPDELAVIDAAADRIRKELTLRPASGACVGTPPNATAAPRPASGVDASAVDACAGPFRSETPGDAPPRSRQPPDGG